MTDPLPVVETQYGELPHQLASLYRAAEPSDALVVAVHGGAWYKGGRSLMATTAAGLADRGHTVAAIAYRQRAADPVADMLGDIGAAMAWARDQGFARVVLLGDSAGAHAVALHTLRAEGAAVPDLWVSLCGALALDALRRPASDEQHTRFPGYVLTLTTGGSAPERLDAYDPVAARGARADAPPPLLAATSDLDFFAASTRAYVDAAVGRGDDVTVHYCGSAHEECRHSWQLNGDLAATRRLFDLIAAWIGRPSPTRHSSKRSDGW